MTFFGVLNILALILCYTGVPTIGDEITGVENGAVTLPCTFSVMKEALEVFWRKAECSKPRAPILHTNGSVTIKATNRYELLGNITQGDASLTITELTTRDKGTYCCKVTFQGPLRYVETEINLEIMETPVKNIIGLLNDEVTLPCAYSTDSAGKGVFILCWGRGSCSNFRSSDAIFSSNSKKVPRRYNRYELLGNITQGGVSLAISRLTKQDEGTYCCKVHIPGPNNNVEKEINLQILAASAGNAIGSVNDTVTLPCTYSARKGLTGLCWGRGKCSALHCPDAILRTNSSKITKKSNRYELLGNITKGNVSLTITRLTRRDEGTYCCKVYVPGPNNDVKKELNLQILADAERLNWSTLGNMIRLVMTFLVPTMVLIIYKCCSL